ncbi:MAG: ABC transporter ATP-binding protein [Lachnospiraceae bacterium]|nr:ABC transporter ATP-binding protein [Lachnospiraceae bacterium]
METRLDNISVDKLIWQPVKKGKPVLDKIDIDLCSGKFYGLLGPNGAGKTSLVRQLLKLQESNSGNIQLDDVKIGDIRRKDMAKKLSFLPQNIHSNVEFTVEEIVAMGREPYRKSLTPLSDEDKNIIREAMEFADCVDFKDKNVKLLSGGERQRVMIARTIAQDTPWIILDEPVSSLDITHQVRLMQLLDRLRVEKKKTIVAILHDINLAATFCTDLILMKDGQVVKQGTKEVVLTKESLGKLYDMEFEFVSREDHTLSYVVPKY